jgi:hypothetical protein
MNNWRVLFPAPYKITSNASQKLITKASQMKRCYRLRSVRANYILPPKDRDREFQSFVKQEYKSNFYLCVVLFS